MPISLEITNSDTSFSKEVSSPSVAPDITNIETEHKTFLRLTDNKSDEILSDGRAGTPAVVTLHVDVESLVGGHHRVLDGLFLKEISR